MNYREGTLRVDERGELRLHLMFSQRLRTALTAVERRPRYIMRERTFLVEAADPDECLRLDGLTGLLTSPRARRGGRLRIGADLHLLLPDV